MAHTFPGQRKKEEKRRKIASNPGSFARVKGLKTVHQ